MPSKIFSPQPKGPHNLLITWRKKTTAMCQNTFKKLSRTSKTSTKWSKTFTNNTINKSTFFYKPKTMSVRRGSQNFKRGFEEKMERGKLRVPKADPCENRWYSWSEDKEIGIGEVIVWDRGQHQETQQALYLRWLMIGSLEIFNINKWSLEIYLFLFFIPCW